MAPPEPTRPGRTLGGRYRIDAPLGSGGMGTVWSARDLRLERDVAVKLGHRHLDGDAAAAARFESEARLLAALAHPNAVAVFDAGTDGDDAYLVMERLSGATLRSSLADGPLPDDELRRLATDLLAVLGAAHATGLLHRDVKPSNLFVGHHGEWKLGDFGIAKRHDAADEDLTLVGQVVGTPTYLAPERLRGEPASVSSDLFAAAVVLHEAATGTRPLASTDEPTAALAASTAPAATGQPAGNREAFVAALRPALATDPAGRYPDAETFAAALRAVWATSPASVEAPSAGAPTVVDAVGTAGTAGTAEPTQVLATAPAATLAAGPAPAAPDQGPSRRRWLAVAALSLLALGGGAAWGLDEHGSTGTDRPPSTATSTTPPKATSTTAAPTTTTTAVTTTVAPAPAPRPPAPGPKRKGHGHKPKKG